MEIAKTLFVKYKQNTSFSELAPKDFPQLSSHFSNTVLREWFYFVLKQTHNKKKTSKIILNENMKTNF